MGIYPRISVWIKADKFNFFSSFLMAFPCVFGESRVLNRQLLAWTAMLSGFLQVLLRVDPEKNKKKHKEKFIFRRSFSRLPDSFSPLLLLAAGSPISPDHPAINFST
jgi:hypothetical protein